ncbi:glycosyltransferase [Eubacterium sp. MSJ-13]|uniref:glycosyltransferase n=1 Tax=Eubacterium sp. MSJ-13 TaxID=2841513 RepID=UPI001C10C5FF|nr:glycosyltransferase [Eubacterium sp. MSJ-13]MBU5477603.1 glycosyltransferase [Eubacterium sp. MSJ-13]
MKRNIAIIIPSLSGGGAERVASVLSQYFSNNNNVYLFLEKYDRRTAYPHSGNIVYLSPSNSENSKVKQFNSILERSIELRKLKKKYNIDVAISFMEEANCINILSKRKEKVIIRVCTILTERKEEFREKIFYDSRFLHWVYNKADNIIVMSKYAKKDLIKNWKIKGKKIEIIENPMNLSYIDLSLNEKIEWNYGDNVLISVNRLDYVKRQWHIIKAFSETVKIIPDAKLLFVGDGECRNRLNVLVKKLGIQENVTFVGHKNNVYPYLKMSKGYILTSKTEGFPNGMLEALYIGTPVISVDCPGAPKEILAGRFINKKVEKVSYLKYGIMVPDISECSDSELCEEEKKLADAMIKLLSRKKIQLHYRDCAKKYISRFDKGNIGKKWDELIED